MSYPNFMINTCTVRTQHLDAYGNPAGDPIDVVEKCRVEWAAKVVRGPRGEQILSSARVYLKKTTTATIASTLVLEGEEHPILTFDRIQNGRHVHHIEAYVG